MVHHEGRTYFFSNLEIPIRELNRLCRNSYGTPNSSSALLSITNRAGLETSVPLEKSRSGDQRSLGEEPVWRPAFPGGTPEEGHRQVPVLLLQKGQIFNRLLCFVFLIIILYRKLYLM